jgi:transcriptional regulator with XRE-family HTH domain
MAKTIQEYMQALMRDLGMTSHREFAKYLGVHHSKISRILNGQYDPKMDFLELLFLKTRTDPETAGTLTFPSLPSRPQALSPLAKLIARRFDELPEEFKREIADAILGIDPHGRDNDSPLLRKIDKVTE